MDSYVAATTLASGGGGGDYCLMRNPSKDPTERHHLDWHSWGLTTCGTFAATRMACGSPVAFVPVRGSVVPLRVGCVASSAPSPAVWPDTLGVRCYGLPLGALGTTCDGASVPQSPRALGFHREQKKVEDPPTPSYSFPRRPADWWCLSDGFSCYERELGENWSTLEDRLQVPGDNSSSTEKEPV